MHACGGVHRREGGGWVRPSAQRRGQRHSGITATMHNAQTGFQKVFVDVQVTNVDRFDHLKPMAKNAANTMQFAADQCNSAKFKRYNIAAQQSQIAALVVPFILQHSGSLGTTAHDFMDRELRRIARSTMPEEQADRTIAYFMQRIVTALHRETARSIRGYLTFMRAPRTARDRILYFRSVFVPAGQYPSARRRRPAAYGNGSLSSAPSFEPSGLPSSATSSARRDTSSRHTMTACPMRALSHRAQ